MEDDVRHDSDSRSAPHRAGEGVPFSLAQQVEFIRKELRETLRDRRTTITLLVMPLLLYPLLGLGLRTLTLQQAAGQAAEEEQSFDLAVESEAEGAWLTDAIDAGRRALQSGVGSEPLPSFQVLLPNAEAGFDLEAAVSELAIDVGVRVRFDDAAAATGRSAVVELFENESSTRSQDAADSLDDVLDAANLEAIQRRAARNGQPLSVPIVRSRIAVEAAKTDSAILSLLPLILLLMTVTGGVYPAIDLTAGERERNTMETLMALPVPRFRLLAAKYVAVVVVTLLTGFMNVAAMGVTLFSMQLDTVLLGEDGFTIGLGGRLLLALAVFALFYAAILLLITSSARSFKEAQAFLIPLLLLSLAPGLVVILPGWTLNTSTAAIPLINILLLTQQMLSGAVDLLPATVAVVSTVLYGAAALAVASSIFGEDAASVGSRGHLRDLARRRSMSSSRPTASAAMTTLALLFPLYFVVSGFLGRGEASPTVRLAASASLTVLIFVAVPWVALRWQRVSLRDGFRFSRARWPFLVAAVLLGLSVWPLVFELVVFLQGLGVRGISAEQIEKVESLLAGWANIPTWLIVLCLGVVPGVCEECFFRGFLFGGIRTQLGAKGTIALSAIAFGLFHLVLAGGAAPERILPSTLMGLLLGWLAWRSDSVVPSLILHSVHNSTLLIVAKSRDALVGWNVGQTAQDHLPVPWVATSAALAAGTLAGLHLLTRRGPSSSHLTREASQQAHQDDANQDATDVWR